MAPKIDGAKVDHRYHRVLKNNLVGRRFARAEAGTWVPVDRAETKILVIVTAKLGENPNRRRGQVSSAMIISRGLVGPKLYRNSSTSKGKQVNIPVPFNNKSWRFGAGRAVSSHCLSIEYRGEP